MVTGHFGPKTLRYQDTSAPRHFGTSEWTFRQCVDTSALQQNAAETVRRLAIGKPTRGAILLDLRVGTLLEEEEEEEEHHKLPQ